MILNALALKLSCTVAVVSASVARVTPCRLREIAFAGPLMRSIMFTMSVLVVQI